MHLGSSTPLFGRPLKAALLLGHSNAGKSPVGEALAARLSSEHRRLVHLDFGALLRRVCTETAFPRVTSRDVAYVRSVMNGRLITEKHFDTVRRLLQGFAETGSVDPTADDLLLNGFPRDTAQARPAEELGIDVRMVIFLDCTPQIAYRRKQRSERGEGFEDRRGRGDEAYEIFLRKVRSFEKDTRPLLDFYAAQSVPSVRFSVGESTSPDQVVDTVAEAVAEALDRRLH